VVRPARRSCSLRAIGDVSRRREKNPMKLSLSDEQVWLSRSPRLIGIFKFVGRCMRRTWFLVNLTGNSSRQAIGQTGIYFTKVG
jgi:hypothetical protein